MVTAEVKAVYRDLLYRHYKAAREGDLNRRDRLFDLIEAFRAEYPAECAEYEKET